MNKPVFETLLGTVARLRAPDGCPWDRAQDHKSLRKHLLEETYEVLELLDQADHPNPHWIKNFKEELGDLLLQIFLHSRIAEEKNLFSMLDVMQELNDKLIRRHPHVFGDAQARSADDALKNWEAQKTAEQKNRRVLDGIPPDLPALQKAQKVIEKVSRVGFQWQNLAGPWNKLEEEVRELKMELDALAPPEELTRDSFNALSPDAKEKLENELGDVLFSLANIAHFAHINPEDSLRSMLNRFSTRFNHVEECVKKSGKPWSAHTLDDLDRFWSEAKNR